MEQSKLQGNWLALDTSTTVMTIALARNGEIIGESDSLSERNHSIRLLPAVQQLLASAQMKAKDLAGIAVGHGPGSYTGIRIGVTVAKTFAWTLGLPIIPISSLEALAYGAYQRLGSQLAQGPAWFVPLMDARRGQVYTGLYAWDGGQWHCVEKDGIRLLTSWLEQLNTHSDAVGQVYFTGDCAAFISSLEAFGESSAMKVGSDNEPLKAASVWALAELYGMEHAVTDIHGFEPNYTQLSEPEKKLVKANPVK